MKFLTPSMALQGLHTSQPCRSQPVPDHAAGVYLPACSARQPGGRKGHLTKQERANYTS